MKEPVNYCLLRGGLFEKDPKKHTIEGFIKYVETLVKLNSRWLLKEPNALELLLTPVVLEVRETGKSTLIAYLLLKEAKKNPGGFIKYVDHADWYINNDRAAQLTGRIAKKIADNLPEFVSDKFSFGKEGFFYES